MLSALNRTTMRVAHTHAVKKIATLQLQPYVSRFLTTMRPLSAIPQSSHPVNATRRIPQRPVAEDENDEVEEEDENDEDYDENEYDPELDDLYDDENGDRQTPRAFVSEPAPSWTATALMPGENGQPGTFKEISSEDYAGKWVVLFFYPLDFTFVCPTEIRAFSDRFEEFNKIGAQVIGCSVDSEYSHLAWTQQPKQSGGLGPMNIPILSDITKSIARNYGVLLEDKGIALRGLFIIDPNGVLRQSTINDLPIGRSVDETLRLVQALQYNETHGEVCPANWKPGQEAMKADTEGLKKYFGKK